MVLRGRMLPRESAAGLRYRAYRQKMRLRAKLGAGVPTLNQPNSGWTPLGPVRLASDASGVGQQDYNWVSGRATAVAADPADATANTVYVGGAYGGVWKSNNAASQDPASVVWTPLIDDQATLAVGALAIQPQLSNPDPAKSVILVGTGEANSSADSYYGLGILRSTDAGGTWTLITSDSSGTRSFAGMAFSKIAFSTTNPNLAVAATAGAAQGIIEGLADPLTANLGLYYSTNGGASWSFASVKDGSVVTEPGSASAVVYNAGAGKFFAALRYHGFYSSSDGMNWTRLSNQPGPGLNAANCPTNPHSTACPIYRGELTAVAGRNEMYAWYVDGEDNDQGIWKTTDGGNSWRQLNGAGITNCGDQIGCGTEQGSYNLELAAVPDGGATDLYAGAINLYKCQITSASPNCGGSGSNTFFNLTHAYGCSTIAKVHPAQHALTFLLRNSGTQDVMYFANDGGIYRALDGFSDLTTGDCEGNNLLDSLNQTLGSMTQMVSFSQPPDDFNTVLGGAQGNGSPATQSALSGSSWLNVNAGDGGYSEINPDNPDEWFVSNPPNSGSGVNIFRCEVGINCHTQDFQNDQVISSATLGGDTGGYYPVFSLDPQSSGEMLVGTCRMWRGTSSGGLFDLLSNNFETGGSGICTGDEINLVRAIAAGGPTDSHGLSNVVYAGTDGFGPLIPTTPPGGRVWVSANVAGGTATWVDQTAGINPNAFPISGIALDTSDMTGLTAYVSVMGFHTSHVWKTTDGGISWSDFSGALPDDPADAILVDPGSNPLTGTVYVGTDVGVFSSPSAGANWSEVGPAPGSGQSGYLPNVAVTGLQIISTGNIKFLRASTYGRGIWQLCLAGQCFVPSVADTPQTVFPEQLPAQFVGVVLFDGYSYPVDLSCEPACTVKPPVVTPDAPSFTITASGPIGTNDFTLEGTGEDPLRLTAGAPFTLNVVDFNLTAPSPDSITVGPRSVSPPVRFQVTAQGEFQQTVDLSCSGLPTGASCNFQPSSSVNPTSGKPVSVTLTISTASDTNAGQFLVTISGSVTNGPTKTRDLNLTVIKDYSLEIKNPTLTAFENTKATFDGVLTPLNGYNSPVDLSCGDGAPPTCTATPAVVTPTSTGAAFTVTVSSQQCGQYNFDILARGNDPLSTSHSAPVTFNSKSLAAPDYTLAISNSPLSSPVDRPATFQGTLTSSACYNYPVTLSCGSGAPSTCTPSPAVLAPTISGAPFTVKVGSTKIQQYTFGIAGQGGDPSEIQHAMVVTFNSTVASGFDFSLTNDSGAEGVTAGQQATFELHVTPQNGKFPDSVTLSVVACPPLSTCSFDPARVTSGSSATSVKLNVQTTAAVSASLHARRHIFLALWLGLPGFVLSLGFCHPRRWRRQILAFCLTGIVMLMSFFVACGGGSLQGGDSGSAQPGTPAGTYTMTVSASMKAAPGSPTKTLFVTLTVN